MSIGWAYWLLLGVTYAVAGGALVYVRELRRRGRRADDTLARFLGRGQ